MRVWYCEVPFYSTKSPIFYQLYKYGNDRTLKYEHFNHGNYCKSSEKHRFSEVYLLPLEFLSDTGNDKQLNIEFEVNNTDRGCLGQNATLLAILVYEKYADYEQYRFGFSNPRMINGWVRFTNQEIFDMSADNRSFNTVMQGVVDRKD